MKVLVHVSMQVEGVLECDIQEADDGNVLMYPVEVELAPTHSRHRVVADLQEQGGARPEWADDEDFIKSMVGIATKKISEALVARANDAVAKDESAEFLGNNWTPPVGGAKC